jgi:hypothetical protein
MIDEEYFIYRIKKHLNIRRAVSREELFQRLKKSRMVPEDMLEKMEGQNNKDSKKDNKQLLKARNNRDKLLKWLETVKKFIKRKGEN